MDFVSFLSSTGQWLMFVVTVIVLYSLPGLSVLNLFSIKKTHLTFFLATLVGIVLITGFSFFFGLLGFRYISFGVALTLSLTLLWKERKKIIQWLKKPRLKLKNTIDRWAVLILLIGVAVQLTSTWNFGIMKDGEVFFCCRGVNDLIYHASLTEELMTNMPPNEPGMYDAPVKNYHYWSNLASSDILLVSGLPILTTISQMIPALLLILMGAALFAIAKVLDIGTTATRWFIFFVYFFGELSNFAHILIHGSSIKHFAIIDNASALMAGPPRGFSIVVLFWCIYLLIKWIQKPQLALSVLLAILTASLAGFKIYTFLLFAAGISATMLIFVWRREWNRLAFPLLALLFSLMVYLPVNSLGSNGFLLHAPYNLYNFIETPDLGLVTLRMRLDIFTEHQNYPKIILYHGYMILLYLIVLFGVNIIGLLLLSSKKLRPLYAFLSGSIVVGLFLGFFSSQKVGGLNTTQFLITLPFILALPTAMVLTQLLSIIPSTFARSIIISGVVLVTSSHVAYATLENLRPIEHSSPVKISADEYEMIQCLREKSPDSLVIIDPSRAKYQPSLIIPALSQTNMYVAGVYSVLQDHGVADGVARYIAFSELYTTTNVVSLLEEIYTHQIDVAFFPQEAFAFLLRKGYAEAICSNQSYTIMRFTEKAFAQPPDPLLLRLELNQDLREQQLLIKESL